VLNSCTIWLRPGNPPPPHPPAFGLVYTRALLVSQDKLHLFVTPWRPHSPPQPQVKEAKKQRRQKKRSFFHLIFFAYDATVAHFRYDIKAAGERVCFKTEQLKISLQLIQTTWKIVQNKVVFYYKVKVRVFCFWKSLSLPDRSLEEPLAAFTTDCSIMTT
jgi:hypothetical protein